MDKALEPVKWMGDSRQVLSDFPDGAKERMGHEIMRVQNGDTPIHWSPMASVGRGVKEIKVAYDKNAYRAVYLVKRSDAIYILHSFQKKTRRTSTGDINIAKARLKEI